jgi:hypothetical protein
MTDWEIYPNVIVKSTVELFYAFCYICMTDFRIGQDGKNYQTLVCMYLLKRTNLCNLTAALIRNGQRKTWNAELTVKIWKNSGHFSFIIMDKCKHENFI